MIAAILVSVWVIGGVLWFYAWSTRDVAMRTWEEVQLMHKLERAISEQVGAIYDRTKLVYAKQHDEFSQRNAMHEDLAGQIGALKQHLEAKNTAPQPQAPMRPRTGTQARREAEQRLAENR